MILPAQINMGVTKTRLPAPRCFGSSLSLFYRPALPISMAPVAMVSRYSNKHIKFKREPYVGRHLLKLELWKLSLGGGVTRWTCLPGRWNLEISHGRKRKREAKPKYLANAHRGYLISCLEIQSNDPMFLAFKDLQPLRQTLQTQS